MQFNNNNKTLRRFVRNMFLIKQNHGQSNDMTKHIYFSTSVGF